MIKTEKKTIIDVPPGAYYFGDPSLVLPAHIWNDFLKYLKENGRDSAALQNVHGKGFIGAIRVDTGEEPISFRTTEGKVYETVSGMLGVVSRNLIPGGDTQRPGPFAGGTILETLGTHALVYDYSTFEDTSLSFFGETVLLITEEVEEDDDEDAFGDDDEDAFEDNEEDLEDSDEEE